MTRIKIILAPKVKFSKVEFQSGEISLRKGPVTSSKVQGGEVALPKEPATSSKVESHICKWGWFQLKTLIILSEIAFYMNTDPSSFDAIILWMNLCNHCNFVSQKISTSELKMSILRALLAFVPETLSINWLMKKNRLSEFGYKTI